MIEIKHLQKAYERATPLRDVNATIRDGDIIAVIGPSGTGKSTLLRCINMLEAPTSGEIWVDGQNITAEGTDIDKLRRKMGMVFQSFNLYEHLTVIENTMFAQKAILKRSAQEAYEKGMSLLNVVGLSKQALQYPDQLSGGQKQRAAIARTLAMGPEIILFDEPTSALDPLMTAEVEAVIEQLARQGTTMMIVTHSMELARRVSNRVFYMDEGEIYEDGTPEQIFRNPTRPKTRAFIMNMNGLDIHITKDTPSLEEAIKKIQDYSSDMGFPDSCSYRNQAVYEEICNNYLKGQMQPGDYADAKFQYKADADEMHLDIKYYIADCRDSDSGTVSYRFVHGIINSCTYTYEPDESGKYDINVVVWKGGKA